jgi:tryptophan synthase alpha chain
MQRIHEAFADAPDPGALIIYLTAGDPSLDATVELALAAERGGADLIELGIAYIAPTADGPTIQAACKRALDAGSTTAGVLDAARRIREQSQIPLVTMTCVNPIIAYGLDDFARDARAAGIDGVLVSDLPPAEATEWCEAAARHDLGTVFLIAPDNTDAQIRDALDLTTGFAYIISRPGTTGARADIYEGLRPLIERVEMMASGPRRGRLRTLHRRAGGRGAQRRRRRGRRQRGGQRHRGGGRRPPGAGGGEGAGTPRLTPPPPRRHVFARRAEPSGDWLRASGAFISVQEIRGLRQTSG